MPQAPLCQMVSGLARVWIEPAGLILMLIPVTLSIKLSGSERKRIRGRRRKWEQKGIQKNKWEGVKGEREVTKCTKNSRQKGDVKTLNAPLLVHVCVFALMHLKQLTAPANLFSPTGQSLAFRKVSLHTRTHKYTAMHTPTQCSWSQLASKCYVLTPLASEDSLSIRGAHRHITSWRRQWERREWQRGGLDFSFPLVGHLRTKSDLQF